MPNETVTIVIEVKVNSSVTKTETLTNTVTLTYENNKSRTASTYYKVIVTSTLPGTGELPLEAAPPNGGPLGGWLPATYSNLALNLSAVALLAWLLLGLYHHGKKGRYVLRALRVLTLLAAITLFITACVREQVTPVSERAVQNTTAAIVNTATPTPSLMPYMPAHFFSTPEAIVRLPKYPIPSPTLVNTPAPDEPPPDTTAVERITIPAINIDTVVAYVPYDGLTWMIEGLREEVAWMGNTSWPGLGSNTVLAGHVTVRDLGDGPFRYLEQLENGDLVNVFTQENIYTYKVLEQLVVEDTDMGVTLPTVNSQLTLITCTGWDSEVEIYRYRRVVVAELVQVDSLVRQGSQK